MKYKQFIAVSVVCPMLSMAALAELPTVEIEQRNAAAAFVLSREAALALVMIECDALMAVSKPSLDTVARDWYGRNHTELETAFSWVSRYLSDLREKDLKAFEAASSELSKSQADALLSSSRIYFSRRVPTLDTCVKATSTFVPAQIDIKNIHLNPGYEQFSEIPETLVKIRSDPSFRVPPNVQVGFDVIKKYLKTEGVKTATLDAMYAADERGDGMEKIAILTRLAKEGDGRSAQTIGLMYMNGNKVGQNYTQAYEWFYAAWSLADMDGLNAMGVILRDGLGMPSNPTLALAAFQVAASTARTRETQARAVKNAVSLAAQLGPRKEQEVYCWTLQSLDDALHAPLKKRPKLTPSRGIANPERKLGALINGPSGVNEQSSCPG